MIRKLMLALASLCLLSFTSAALADETLSNSELQKLFPGSFTAVVNGIVVIEIIAKDNGILIGRMKGKVDSGRWSLRNGKLCIMWSNWTDGKSSCSLVVAENGWYRGQGVKFRKL